MPRKIAVLTSYMHQRGGDLISAMSFMKAVLAVEPDTEFEWVVKRDISSFNRDLEAFKAVELGEFNKQVHLQVVNSSDYDNVTIDNERIIDKRSKQVLTPKQLTDISDTNWGHVRIGWKGWQDIITSMSKGPVFNSINSCDSIAVVANNHRLIQKDYQFLAKTFKKPIKLLPEYDLSHVNNTNYGIRNVELITTGFAGSGVYIDQVITSENHLNNTPIADKSFIDHLSNHDLNQYHQSNRLFYGYFFDIEALSPAQFIVKTKSYITNSIMLAMDQGDKINIDIVIPGFRDAQQLQGIYQQALQELPLDYQQRLRQATYDLKNSAGQFDSSTVNSGTGSFNVRLINPKRLERQTIQALLNDSEPWVGLTGDASWIEGIMKGKIVCYQIVQWKIQFFEAFLTYASSKLAKDSPLLTFYRMQNNPRYTFQNMRELYLKNVEKMQEEAIQLAQWIAKEKNLNTSLKAILGLQTRASTPTEHMSDVSDPENGEIVEDRLLDKSMARSPGLQSFITTMQAHLDNLPKTGTVFTTFTSVHEASKQALRTALANGDKTMITAALQTYYNKISHPGVLAGWVTTRHKNQFEHLMCQIGVVESNPSEQQLIDALKIVDIEALSIDAAKHSNKLD